MIDYSFTKEQDSLREAISVFAKCHLNKEVAQSDQAQFFDRSLWKTCGSVQLPGLCIPKAYGGRGLNALDTTIALEALGYSSENDGFNFALAAHMLACLVPIHLYGTEAQKQYYLPELCNGEKIATNAMTESSAGSDVYQMSTIAETDGDNFRLNGHKVYCSNAPVADVVVTYAVTNKSKGFFGGLSAFILDKKQHAFQTTERIDKLGLRSCQLGEVFFEDSQVGADAVLGKIGSGGPIFQKSMEWERICLGALHLGAMDRMLEKATAFVNERISGGQSISKFQAVTHPLVNLKVRLESARLLTYKSAWRLDQHKNVAADASICKLAVSETYKDMAMQMMQLYAGKAYREHSDAERNLRDAISATIYSGTSEIQRNIIARYMGMK